MNPLLYTDCYKLSHFAQTPSGTTLTYSNFTPRSSRIGTDYSMWFGLQYAIKEYLIKRFKRDFFDRPKEEVMEEISQVLTHVVGPMNIEHFGRLHDLGYLPIKIKALPEGSKVNLRIPAMTIYNTHPDFFWLTNYLETLLSSLLWMPSTTMTTAYIYRKTFDDYAQISGNEDFCDFQGHDFSFRGMSSPESAIVSGMAFLTCFKGTDTIPAVPALVEYYGGDYQQFLAGSVPATEHAIASLYTAMSGEFSYFEDLITKIYPSGIVSLVSDTYDYWGVLTNFLPRLKDKIMARDGKVVIRPDSSPKTPFEIICGDPEGRTSEEVKGSIQILWETFGGTINSKGFKELDSHIGLIYGEAITPEMQEKILHRLVEMGFASTNVVLGLGSYGFQMKTRDSLGWACKQVYAENNGTGYNLFKSPKTDSGSKKSATGLLRVNGKNGHYTLEEGVSWDREGGCLETVFEDGKLVKEENIYTIRKMVNNE